MKTFITVLALILSFQSLSMADDITDFEIEGMSVGDSLLNFMSKPEINSSKRNYTKNKKYYVVGYNDLKIYESMDIYLKRGDESYEIRTLGAFIFLKNKECLKKKKEIVKSLRDYFSSAKEETNKDQPHTYDKSGKSRITNTVFLLEGNDRGDHIRVECTDWSKEFENKNWSDNLSVGAYSKEILKWFDDGYN